MSIIDRFIHRPLIKYDYETDPERPWVVVGKCSYSSTVVPDFIVIPDGYRTDLASVPRIPGIHWRYGGRAVLPSIVHDYLYDTRPKDITRLMADQVFWEAMKAENDPSSATARWAMYMGVRIGGRRGWYSKRKD